MKRPNVLLIITDQQRPDSLGFTGKTPCRTPHLDRLAAEGISFANAFTPCPLCLPARASLFTGRYPTQNDMMSNATGQLRSCDMLDVFRSAGYQVNYAGKWHMGEGNIGEFTDRHAGDSTSDYSLWCREQGLPDGWMFNDPATRTHRSPSMSIPKVHCQNLPVSKTNEAYITDFATDMIRSRDLSRPFFQVCAYNGPHPPFMIPEPYFSMYDPQVVAMPENFGPQPGEHQVHAQSYYRQLFVDHGMDFEDWRATYAVYWGFVSMIDNFVGQLLATLDDEGLTEDTIIIFTSDHGEMLGAHGLWHKMVPFEEGIRIPLLMRLPGGPTDRHLSAPASLVDIAPTLASLCDVPNAGWQGRDLLAEDQDGSETHAIFGMHEPLGEWMHTTDWRMIRRDSLKYVWHRGLGDELFDLVADTGETVNHVASPDYHNRLTWLQDELDSFLQTTNDPLLAEWRAERKACAGEGLA